MPTVCHLNSKDNNVTLQIHVHAAYTSYPCTKLYTNLILVCTCMTQLFRQVEHYNLNIAKYQRCKLSILYMILYSIWRAPFVFIPTCIHAYTAVTRLYTTPSLLLKKLIMSHVYTMLPLTAFMPHSRYSCTCNTQLTLLKSSKNSTYIPAWASLSSGTQARCSYLYVPYTMYTMQCNNILYV